MRIRILKEVRGYSIGQELDAAINPKTKWAHFFGEDGVERAVQPHAYEILNQDENQLELDDFLERIKKVEINVEFKK